MGTCRITQLKSTVSDDTLPILGAIRIEIKKTSNTSLMMWFATTSQSDYSYDVISGDATFTKGNQDATHKNLSLSSITTDSVVSVSPKNIVTRVQGSGLKFSIDDLKNTNMPSGDSLYVSVYDVQDVSGTLDSLSGKRINYFVINRASGSSSVSGSLESIASGNSDILTRLDLTHCPNVGGNISCLSNHTALGVALLQYTNIEGNISSLVKLTSMTAFRFSTGVIGTVESLAEGQWSNGRRSGTLTLMSNANNQGNITFHSSKITYQTTSLIFSANSVEVQINSVAKGTYNGSSWTYV